MVAKRSFTPDSYFNSPIPASVPVDTKSTLMTLGQAKSCPPPKVQTPTGNWAMPWSEVTSTSMPFATITDGHTKIVIRIDPKIGQMTGDDAAAVFRDWTTGYDVATFETKFVRKPDGTVDTNKPITCTGYGHYLLNSNGLAKQVGGVAQNSGHRGIPGSLMALTADEAAQGLLQCKKISLGQPADSPGPNWPMYGIESPRDGAIPEGARFRLKKGKADPGNPIQVAANVYGFIVGDTAGQGKSSLKTVQGGTYSSAVLKALDNFTWADYEVMRLGAKWGR